MAGRPKKPLALQSKHLTKEQILEQELVEKSMKVSTDNIKCPSFLTSKIAKKEWKRLWKELKDLDIITQLDVTNLGAYCNAYANYVTSVEELSKQTLTITKQLPNGAYASIENPLIKIQKGYADEMRKFGSLCGLSFDSRLRMGALKVEKTKTKVNDDFGDI